MATIAASTQPATRFESPASGGHFLSTPGQEPVRAVGERFAAHPGVFGAPGATPSVRGGPVPTAAPKSNAKIVYARPSAARLSMGNGLDLLQAGDAVFLHREPPFLHNRQQKQVQAASLQRVNALLAGPDGALDINDAATRARIKEVRIAHYTTDLEAANMEVEWMETRYDGAAGITTQPPNVKEAYIVAREVRDRAAEKLENANNLPTDVDDNALPYGVYDLEVDWRALPLLRDWHFDGMLVGSNAERESFDFDTDLLNVAIGGPTPVRNFLGQAFYDEARKKFTEPQRFDPRPQTADDAVLLLVHEPQWAAGTVEPSDATNAALRFRFVPATTRQLHPEMLFSGAFKTVTERDVRHCVGVLRLGRIMDTKKGQTLMLLNLAPEWRSPRNVFVDEGTLEGQAHALLKLVEEAFKVDAAAAYDRIVSLIDAIGTLNEAQTETKFYYDVVADIENGKRLRPYLKLVVDRLKLVELKKLAVQAKARYAVLQAAKRAADQATPGEKYAAAAEAAASAQEAATAAAKAAVAQGGQIFDDLSQRSQELLDELENDLETQVRARAGEIDEGRAVSPDFFVGTASALFEGDALLEAALSPAEKTALRMHIPIAAHRGLVLHAQPKLAEAAARRAAATASSGGAPRASAPAAPRSRAGAMGRR